MDKNGNTHFNEQLRERTRMFALRIRKVIMSINVNPLDKPNLLQLIRSSSSIAANYSSATCARSDQEFFAKICIVLEEADEAKFWLGYLLDAGVLKAPDIKPLCTEADELVRIFSSIKMKMKVKLGK
ncbi:MAG: four helix bundle protein [Bacteroidetes bacterium]|nr:four helix bundle protein [Bacteroidota bacterium]